jgi:hypothetical protein
MNYTVKAKFTSEEFSIYRLMIGEEEVVRVLQGDIARFDCEIRLWFEVPSKH